MQLGENDTICVFRRDRTIIMRRPFDLDIIGKRLGDMPRGKQPTMGEENAFSGLGPVDDIRGFMSAAPSTSPFVVIVGKPISDILEPVADRGDCGSARIMMALIVFVLAVTLFLAREIQPPRPRPRTSSRSLPPPTR